MILTIVATQSTTDTTSSGGTGTFHIRQSRPLVIAKEARLVSVTTVHLQDTVSDPHAKLIIVRIPWLSNSTHAVAAGTNLAIANADVPAQAFDARRSSTQGIYITCLESSTYERVEEDFEVSTSVIPSAYDIEVLDARTGLPYSNLSTLVLKFELTRSGLF